MAVIAAVVLAAGTSSRFGGDTPKQLLDFDGKPLAQHAVDAAAEAGLEEIVVVTGHMATEVEGALRLPPGARVVHNRAYATGMAGSLRTGLAALGPDVDAAVVLLADQPQVDPGAVRRVVEAFGEDGPPIVQARYRDTAGHPVLLGRDAWPLLDDVAGDVGARAVIAVHPELVRRVEIDADAPPDVDTSEDYRRMRPPS